MHEPDAVLVCVLVGDEPELEEPVLDDFERRVVNVGERAAHAHRAEARLLRGEHDVVDVRLLFREFAADGEGARNVRGVVAVLRARVYEQEVAGVYAARGLFVM